jgi:hypothetical protein
VLIVEDVWENTHERYGKMNITYWVNGEPTDITDVDIIDVADYEDVRILSVTDGAEKYREDNCPMLSISYERIFPHIIQLPRNTKGMGRYE